jgi:4-amino-4-deoxy-L-arabinose transferase-like glycosyltransferase
MNKYLLPLILLLGAVLRFSGITFGLPNPEIRPDENVIVGIALGMTYAGLNPHFFHWPSLEFYALAAVYRVAFIYGHSRGWYHIKFDMFRAAAADATSWLMVPRVLAACSGVITIWLVYRVMRELFDRSTGLLAAFFIAVAFLHVRDSHFGVTDIPATLLTVAAMLPLSRLLIDPARRRDWIRAGVFSGLAASTKYNGGIVAAVGLAVAFVWMFDRDTPARRGAALRGLAVFTVAAGLAFLAGTPFAILDARHFIEGLQFDSEHLMTGHGMKLERGWIYHLYFSLWYGLGPPLLMAGVVGMFLIIVRSWKKAVVLCTFPLLYYLLVGRGYTVFARYVDPVVPFLCMTAAFAVMVVVRTMRTPAMAGLVAAALSLVLAAPSLQRDIQFDSLIGKPDTRILALKWLDDHRKPADWVMEDSPALLHATFVTAPPMLVRFDEGQDAFFSPKGERVQPDWVVLPRGPLPIYMNQPGLLFGKMTHGYTLAARFLAGGDESPLIFDQQDMYFVPMGDFSARERPGPDVYIYRRVMPSN